MLIYNEIGMTIRYLRNLKGLTLEQLAYDCGVSPSYLGSIETGKANPTIKELSIIAEGLEVDVRNLIYVSTPTELRQSKDVKNIS